MIIIDNVLLFPMKGMLWLARKISEAVDQDSVDQIAAIKQRLSEIYLLVETGQMPEDEFERLETELLDRLDQLENSNE